MQAAQAELSGQNAREEFSQYNENVIGDAVSVASDFIRGAKITPESFRAETGYGAGEQRRFVGMIASAENGGKSIDRLAEELVSYDNSELNGVTYRGDTSLAKDAILEALQAAGTRGELAQNNTAEREKYVEARMADLDAQYMEAYGMTYDEYLSYEEQIMPTIWRDYNNYDEVAFNNMYAEEIQQLLNTRENGNTTGEKQTDDRGNQVLSEQQSIEQPGSAGSTEPGTEIQAGVQSNNENAAPQEEQPTVAQNDSGKAIGERLWRYINFLNNQYGYNFEHEETFAKWITKKKNNIKWLKDKFPPNVVKEVIRAINDYNKLLTKPTVSNKIADAEAQTDTNPTEAQKEAGNYKKGHVRIDGYDITIEQPKGSVRRGTDANGKKWEQTMNNTYGYIRGTEGVDGDHIDIFLSDNPTEGNVYVVDQVNPDGSFDEHKVMYGFNSEEEARNAYLSNYEEGWQGLGNITEVSKDEFKKWVESSHRKTKPFAEYKSVNAIGAQNEVSDWLGIADLNSPIHANNPKLVSIANILQNFENPSVKGENNATSNGGNNVKEESKQPSKEEAKRTKKQTAKLPLTEGEYADKRMKELMKDNPKLDEDDAENQALEEYPSYIGEMIKSGELENLYAQSSINDKIKLGKIVESAGFGVSDISGTANKERQEEKKRNLRHVGDKVSIEYLDGSKVEGVITEAKDGNITVKSNDNGRLYTVPERNIIPLSEDADNIRFRFIGEQGAARLDAAEEATTRLDNLATARRMEQAYIDKKARIEKLRDSEPVEITGNEIEPSDDLKQYKKNALEYGKKLQGSYVNKDTGRTIQLQRGRKNGGLKEVLQHDINDVAHIKSVAAIPQIIENSIYIDSADNHDTKKNPNVSKYHYYVCGLKIGGVDYTVRMVEAEDKDGNRYYDHKLTHIEKGNLIDNNETAFVQTSPTELSSTPGTGAEERNRPTNRGEIQAAPISKSKDRVLISLLQTNERENARKIKIATGWERGADGQWRYETPDFEYYPNGDARQDDKYKESDWYKELYALEDKLFDGETLTDEEQKRFDELAERENEIRDNEKNTDRVYLDDYVKDDELFKAYPELKQTRVDFVDIPNAEYSAKYNEQENRITVNTAKSMDNKSVLAHEIQHAIQRIEGFANGSNTDNYRNMPTSENVISDIVTATDGRLLEDGGFDNTPQGIFDALNRKTTYGTILRDYNDELDTVAQKYGYDNIFDLVNDIDKFKSSVQMYLSESGEVEARNVQTRLDMSPEERRQSLAEETEDVAREDQTFLQDALGTSESRANEDIDAAVSDIAGKLNIGVRVAHSIDEVNNDSARRAIEQGRGIQGFYDTRTGEIVVYAPNAVDADDAVRTVLHEGVAHYGLRQLVGEENFGTFLDNIYNNVSDELKQQIDAKAREHNWSARVATEEYLASLAEDTNFEQARNSGIWQKIKDFFTDLLTKAGIHLANPLTENELRYILWRSYDNLKNPTRDAVNTARDMSMQRDLNVGNYATQDLSEDTEEADGVRYREVDEKLPPQSRNKFREQYEEGIKGRIATLNRAYFDSMQPMKKLQEAIAKETSQAIAPEENVYLQENRAMSVANRKYEIWERSHMEPVREAVVKLMEDIRKGNFLSDVLKRTNSKRNAYNAVIRYMKSKHGLENNEYRRDEAAMAARKPFEDEIAAVQKSAKDNKMSEADAEKKIKELREQADKAEAESRKKTKDKDYSGLQGIYGKDFEQKAKDYVGAFEERFNTDDFWEKWNGATKSILSEEYDAGLISKELYDKIRGMYKYYIPLKGWAENRAEDVYTYYTTGSGDGGKPQSRKGRTSESDDPLVTLEQDADRQFNAAARNNVKRSLYNLATTHKSDLLTVRRQWYQNMGTKENPDWQRVDAEIPENATPEEMEKIVSDFEKNMRELAKDGMAMRQKRPMILPYHATKRMEKEHTVRVMVNGKEYVIYVNGDPAAAQAVNGTSTPKDPDNKFLENFVLRPLRWFNRTRAALLTAWNFNFIPSNLSRDAQYSIQNMKAKEPATYVMRYIKNLGEGMAKFTSARLFYKDKNGTLDMNDPTERLFKEFLDNGGETGYSKTMTLEQRRRNNMSAINKLSGIDWAKGVRLYFDALAYVNRSVETIVRFAAYKTSREAGRSIVQSVNDAKEASVNFDKHGSGEYGNKEWRLLYIFANVKFQSMRRMLENATGHPVRFALAQAERFALGFAVPMMAKLILDSLGDDDEKDAYDALPEWMRRSGISIPISPIVPGVPKRTFLYLPLGPEDKVWYALGEMSWHEFNSDEPNEDMAKEFTSLVADLLPVDVQGYGGNMLVNLAPTAVQDLVALEQNVNYWGQPIYRETTPYNENEPGQNLAFAGTPEWFVKRAEDINRLTGGNDYSKGAFSPKPEQIEYVTNQAGGGVTRVISQFIALVERAGEDGNKDIPALKNTPVLSSFVKQAEEKEGGKGFDREAYYKYVDEYEKAIHDLKAYTKGMKKGDDEASRLAEELKKSPAGERMDTIRNNIGKIRAMDKAIRKLNEIEKPTPKQEMQLEELKKESNEMKNELVDKLDDITEKRGE